MTFRRLCVLMLSLAAGCKNQPPPEAPPVAAEEAAEPEPVAEAKPAAREAQPDLLPPQTTPQQGSADTRNPQEIQRVITENRAMIRECYEEALKTNPGIEGDLVIGFVISPSGKVKSAEVNWKESDIHVPELEECALARIGLFEFPPSSRGLESKVTYPYNFHPGH